MSIAERWRRFRELPPDILLRLNGLAPLLKGEGVLLAYLCSARILYAAAEEQRLTYELAVLRQYKDTAYLRRQQEQILRRSLEAWSLNVTV
jgi:hypothetical protein